MIRKNYTSLLEQVHSDCLTESYRIWMKNRLKQPSAPPEKSDELQKVVKTFKVVYKRKWIACNSTESRFSEKDHEWLNGETLLHGKVYKSRVTNKNVKKQIQKDFKDKLGLLVDIPKVLLPFCASFIT
ncbi:uncharacterized protein [Leptinotarsa decemlineata]|uniref:uncharacterized protein n=1 Tax=Leptinotarsa decemlineata TaxID=7539 RepID=UPI003D307F1C